MKQSKVIGITGSIAAGKSTVCSYLEEKYGVRRLDADKTGHEVIMRPEVVKELTKAFGKAILDSAGVVNRKALGSIVFADPHKLQLLNQITHPVICDEIRCRIQEFRQNPDAPIFMLEAIELLRTPLKDMVEENWVVWADDEVRVQRIMKRQNLDEQEARNRVQSQWSQENYKAAADVLIDGGGTVEELHEALDRLMERMYGKEDHT